MGNVKWMRENVGWIKLNGGRDCVREACFLFGKQLQWCLGRISPVFRFNLFKPFRF